MSTLSTPLARLILRIKTALESNGFGFVFDFAEELERFLTCTFQLGGLAHANPVGQTRLVLLFNLYFIASKVAQQVSFESLENS